MLTKTTCPNCRQEYLAATATYAADPERRCLACITAWTEQKPCPDCAGGPITSKNVQTWMQYASGSKKTFLKTIDPLRTCGACDFCFFDHAIEEIHLIAVNRYLAATGQTLVEK